MAINGVNDAGMQIPVAKRSFLPTFMVLIKKHMETVLSSLVDTKIFKVRISNEKAYGDYMARILKEITALNTTIKSLPKIELKDSPASINIQSMSEQTVVRIANQMEGIRQALMSYRPPKAPNVHQVFPYEKLLPSFDRLEAAIKNIKMEAPRVQEKPMVFPKSMKMEEGVAILKALGTLTEEIKNLPKRLPEMQFPNEINIGNFPPQKIPQPVTNININALHGYPVSTAITVGTSAVGLPTTALASRRSLVVYNNDAVATLYVGGSNVTTTNGMPVPPLSYSPAFDAGADMIVYGISTTSINVRTLEVSNDREGR